MHFVDSSKFLNSLKFFLTLQERYAEAKTLFQRAVDRTEDFQSMFQLGVIYYDGLGCPAQKESQVRLNIIHLKLTIFEHIKL